MIGTKTILSICILVLALAGATTRAEEKTVPSPDLPPVQVHVLTLQRQEIPSLVEVVGTVQAVQRASIAAKVSGFIAEIPVVLGSRVNKGDLLVKISAEEISARLLQAQAQLAQARRNLEREQKLLRKKATTPETVKSMRDMYAIAEAGYREARTMLSYTTITAPFAGVITRKIAHAGDLATPGTPLLELENNSRLQIVTALPEGVATEIRTGERMMVTVSAARLTDQGTVAEIAPVADPRSRTVRIKIDIRQAGNLRTGQFARVAIPMKNTETLLVPASAIVPFGQMDRVYVAEEGRARLRLVRTGEHDDGKVEILAGLNPGDRVIVDNNRLLVNGQPLKIVQ